MPVDLHELEAIKRLKYKYLRCLDQKRWDEIATCFTADATCSYSGGKYAFTGRDAIVSRYRAIHSTISWPSLRNSSGVIGASVEEGDDNA